MSVATLFLGTVVAVFFVAFATIGEGFVIQHRLVRHHRTHVDTRERDRHDVGNAARAARRRIS